MRVTPLHTQWLPTRDACAQLGVTRRTLQRRAAAGAIDTRPAPDGRTLYAVPATGSGATVDAPAPATRHPATPATHPATHPAVAALAGELAVALERAVRAELERDAARAQVAQLEAERDEARAAGVDLAARLVKRGRILRELAARLAP